MFCSKSDVNKNDYDLVQNNEIVVDIKEEKEILQNKIRIIQNNQIFKLYNYFIDIEELLNLHF